MFRRPQIPPDAGFPSDSVVVIVPRVLIERLLTLAIALTLGGTIQVTLYYWNSSGANSPVPSNQKH
jgi:hypothetical protein